MIILKMFLPYLIIVYSIYKLSFIIRVMGKNNRLMDMKEIIFLKKAFNVDIKAADLHNVLDIIALNNAFIFAFALTATSFIDNLIIRLVVLFVILIPLIYIVYFMSSKFFKKKGKKK